MGSLDTFVGKYIRLTDDLHEMRAYLNDIRICFVALTVSCYVGIVMYAFLLCFKRRNSGDGDSSDGTRTTRFPQNSQACRRSNSRFDGSNYDAEAGGGGPPPGAGGGIGNTNEWDDMMPPPPNGSAVKTLDGYRYRQPAGTRGNTLKSPFQAQNRLSVQTDTLDPNLLGGGGGKRQSLIVDNHTGTAALVASSPTGLYQTMGRRSPSEHAFRDGFIEKSPSIT